MSIRIFPHPRVERQIEKIIPPTSKQAVVQLRENKKRQDLNHSNPYSRSRREHTLSQWSHWHHKSET
jgi:hypothetical protein